MRIRLRLRPFQQASVLMVTLGVAFVLGMTLCSYLVLTGAQERSVIRSQRWNAALNLAEAGVEEALAQMNSGTNAGGTGYLAANGWGSSAGGVYGPVSRHLAGGTYVVSFETGLTPTIYSTGYVTVPITGRTISRKVKVTTLQLPLINVPLGAVDKIDMNGNGAATDSWNSYDTNLSLNGYYDSSRTRSNGSVASVEGVVDIGNHTILGNLYLGPDASYVSGTNQVTGTIYYDYNVQFPDAQLPPGTSWFAAPLAGGVHHFTSANTALYNTFWVNDSQDITVDPGVQVVLDIKTSNFQPGTVTILGGLTNSGTLTVYQESGSATLAGSSTVPNPGNTRPSAFWYYGLPGVTKITLSGASTFLGVIYAPEASLKLNGGGSGNNLIGSAIVNTVTLNGHYDFHYDESLLTNGPVRGFVPASWQEM